MIIPRNITSKFCLLGVLLPGKQQGLTLIAKHYDVFSPEICMKKQRRIAKAIKRSRTVGEFVTVRLTSSCVVSLGNL